MELELELELELETRSLLLISCKNFNALQKLGVLGQFFDIFFRFKLISLNFIAELILWKFSRNNSKPRSMRRYSKINQKNLHKIFRIMPAIGGGIFFTTSNTFRRSMGIPELFYCFYGLFSRRAQQFAYSVRQSGSRSLTFALVSVGRNFEKGDRGPQRSTLRLLDQSA